MKSSRWLNACIVGVVGTIAVLSAGWTVGCSYGALAELPYAESETCKNHEERAITTLIALLATLISLKSNPPEADG